MDIRPRDAQPAVLFRAAAGTATPRLYHREVFCELCVAQIEIAEGRDGVAEALAGGQTVA